MKKTAVIIIVVLLLITTVSVLVSCQQNTELNTDTFSYNSKYILDSSMKMDENFLIYVIFRKNGIGEYHNYHGYDELITRYIINFKYFIADNTVFCFYDSIEHENNDFPYDYNPTYWEIKYAYTKELLMEISGNANIWLNENFIDRVPNYNS